MLNRLSLAGIARCITLSDSLASFLLHFPQGDDADDGAIRVRISKRETISRVRRAHEGLLVEVGGQLREDSDGLYLECFFVQTKITLMNRWASQKETENVSRTHS